MSSPQPPVYHASPEVLQQLKQVTLLGVVGPSGVGKTTLIGCALAQDPALHLVISETSRSPRPGEQDGIDYHFRSRQHMARRIEQCAYAQLPPQVTNDLYATAPESYHPDGISVLAIWADAIPDFRALPFKTMRTVFIVPPSLAVWQARFGERDAMIKRLAEARRSFTFALQDTETKVLINDDLHKATKRFIHYAQGSPLTPELAAEQQHGRDCIRAILAEIQ